MVWFTRAKYNIKMCQVMRTMTMMDNKKLTIIRISVLLEKSVIILPRKYSDFANIFSKTNINIFAECSMYGLTIKTKKKKILLFDFIYDFLRVELQILKDYINKILAKDFII